MAAFRWIVSTLAAVLPLLLAHIAVPSAAQDTSLQQCYWPLNSTQSETLASIAAALDYFPYDMSFITTCVNVGLTCSDNGYVTQINWQYKAIQGELPSEIFQLMHLEYLSLRDNYLRGSIPSEIGSLVNLTFLDLSNNSFSGPFPTFFSKLTKLSYLYMRQNNFSGSIPDAIGNMVSLNDIDLTDNSFSGSLPASMGQLTNLNNIVMSRNQISGSLPPSFSKMASLSNVYLDDNLLSGSLEALAALSSLSDISLRGNRFRGSIPAAFAANVFTSFDVSVNDLSGPLPSGLRFSEPPGGPQFNASFNRLSGVIPPDFPVNSFFVLDLSHNELSGRAFFSGQNEYPRPYTINFSHNNFSGALDPSVSTLTYLHDLDLSANHLTGSIPAFISSLTALTLLDLSSNEFTGAVPPAVSSPTGLLSMNLAHNLLQGSLPRALSRLASLTLLNVSSNQLSGDLTPALSALQSLELVDMSANALNSSIPPFFGRMPNMTHLDMSINLLTGSVPPSILTLRRLSHLNASHNRLSGPLPYAAASPALIIDLSFNMFSGSLDKHLFNLNRLALLALHHNQLSGRIPEYLCQSVLQIILLSNNALSAALPQCLPFLSSLQLIDVSNNLLYMDATTFQNMPPIRLDIRSNYLYGSISPSPNITLSSSSSSSSSSASPPLPSLLLPAAPQAQSFPPWVVLPAAIIQEQGALPQGQGGSGTAGGGGGAGITVAWLAVEGNCVGSEGAGQQRGAAECAAVCGIEAGQGPCGGAGAGECVLSRTWPPSLSCSCSSGYVAVTANGTANTTTCQLPPPSPAPPSSGLSAGVVAGIVVGAVLLVAAVAALLFLLLRPVQRRLLDLDQCVAYRIDDIRRATNNFSEDCLLGEGGFGSVYKGTSPDGTLWAIKRAKFMTNDFEKEVRAVATLRHQHLVRLLGYCMDYNAATGHQEQILVYEFVPHGDLSHYLDNSSYVDKHALADSDANSDAYTTNKPREPLSFADLVRIAQGAAEGLAYLHHSLTPPIVHRDVKPANILIDKGRTAKLGDFGLLKTDNLENATMLAGTPGYMDPDYGDSSIVTTKSDVFSFGVVLLEMMSGKKVVLEESGVAFSYRHISIWANELVMAGKIAQVVREDLNAPPDAIIMFVDLAMDCLKRPGALRPEIRDVARRLAAILAIAEGNAPAGDANGVKQKPWTGTDGSDEVKAADEAAEPFKEEKV
ncbi:hypothetical protein CLOM_g18859 [Closterium sp. NIES-68]|nr:hypothetical protein CLOM_g18859 [Closterium sp. NIES-68]GJP76758.1 hypothetical protein CLOP_g7221 [Closterium sp. NIES-67]